MVSLTDAVPNEWYISIVCACGERLILFQDLTHGESSLGGELIVTCPTCFKRGSYPAQHYNHQPGKAEDKALSRAS